MLVHCTSCNQQTDARINKKTGKVMCPICDGEVQVTSFARQAMENSRDYVEDAKTGFGFRCVKCNEIQPAVVNREGTKALCTKCGSEMEDISPFMISTMRHMGRVVDKVEKENES